MERAEWGREREREKVEGVNAAIKQKRLMERKRTQNTLVTDKSIQPLHIIHSHVSLVNPAQGQS
jgi:hypothetical protein